jgi:hypothetical protein
MITGWVGGFQNNQYIDYVIYGRSLIIGLCRPANEVSSSDVIRYFLIKKEDASPGVNILPNKWIIDSGTITYLLQVSGRIYVHMSTEILPEICKEISNDIFRHYFGKKNNWRAKTLTYLSWVYKGDQLYWYNFQSMYWAYFDFIYQPSTDTYLVS